MAKKNSNSAVTTNDPKLRPTMGNGASHLGNVPAPVKGKSVSKKNQAKGGFLEAATATHRASIMERNGASLHPTATLYQANAASAGDVQRNVVTVPSAVGNRDFYLRRQYRQGM
ncbi:hypothetical protein PV336_16110 [Streptomyces sp. MI02-2A]|uniref:hypothetical protein n=1 Tax=Streptomyces sp. MI02-2A TaxID=3028688 RepID=UPI0029B10DF7|nr:hypothetical protein [Streptomyces sp. MI02-2A]MDX3260745.1 hypothetical protein [Streptomyces sp. MI02-2A]